ncbi:ATP-dependent dethiobiotin synthetase BioD [Paracoccus sp. Z330]|uniref:ATP-dependent dethiobiotin synthetase BioD n=1 Tax=Paracoccus onchidii TaxID=3017813 RepID=A0ABT4ZJ33_9RHOB|nr:ATP-dependent dethiobiotin synthetase BioD [Paracoccus onchidii]MDB6178756.1 ATP-dependent dethiobiotin synthetase BioD [Paracoccus onchidii]
MARFVITGTGTDIGKTVFAAGLCGLIGARYWKPVQTGLAQNLPNLAADGRGHQVAPSAAGQPYLPPNGTDSAEVARLSGQAVFPESYLLREPLSPHRAAELDGVTIDPADLVPPDWQDLVIEGAGGVLVPITRDLLYADLFATWQIPVVLVCSTGLGTISHSLTAVESLRARNVALHGLAFVGDDNADNIATIAELAKVRVLGRLPQLPQLDRHSLAAAMHEQFDPEDFR